MQYLPAPVTRVVTVITTPEVDRGYAVLIRTLRELRELLDAVGDERQAWYEAFAGNPNQRTEITALNRAYDGLQGVITSLSTANRSAALALELERERRRGRGRRPFDLLG